MDKTGEKFRILHNEKLWNLYRYTLFVRA